jgi:uncharacterized RDD family membrane protein YckC
MSYRCPKCGNGFESGTKFCNKCGYDLENNFIEEPVCPICNKSYPPNTIHCTVDGNVLVKKEELMPKCEICNTSYEADVKFCPLDGGQVKPIGKARINLVKKTDNVTTNYESEQQVQYTNYQTEVYYETTNTNYYQEGTYNNYEFNGYPKASLGNRFLASLIDGFISLLLSIPAIILFILGLSSMDSYSGGAFVFFFFAVILYLIPLTYNYIKDGLGEGQSFGKRSMGLMVVNLDNNTPCSKGKSFFRNFISSLLSGIPYVGWMIEPIVALANSEGRKLGDKAANTQVIEKSNFNPNY